MSSEIGFRTIPMQARIAVISFSIAGVVAALASLFFNHQWPATQSLTLVGIAVVMAQTKVKLTGSSTISPLTSIVLLSLMMGGTGLAVVVGICGVVAQTVLPSRKLVWHQVAFNAGMIALTVCVTGGIFQALARDASMGFAEFFTAPAASLVYFFGNSSSIALIVGLSRRMSALEVWRSHMISTAPSFLIAGILSKGLYLLVASPAAGLVLTVIPVISSVYYISIWITRGAAAESNN